MGAALQTLTLLSPFLFILLGYLIGKTVEASHFKRLAAREAATADVLVTNLRQVTDETNVRSATFVSGEAAIATDFFKNFAGQLRNLVGGEVKSYNSLLERARREARLRMVEQARELGATEVWNLRYGTSNIRSSTHQRNNPGVSVEIVAYGTAIVRNTSHGAPQARPVDL